MSTTQLRQRSNQSSPSMNNNMEGSTSTTRRRRDVPEAGTGLNAKQMIDSAPQQHGAVLKLHIPIFYSILPQFLKNIILSFKFFSFLAPSWKQRYLILCGSYLYKFKDEKSEVPKGEPFDVETLAVSTSDNEMLGEFSSVPSNFTSVFSVSTLRRKHYYAVADTEEAMMWIRSLQQARQETITRNMGHASNVPYPKSWSYFDSLGKGLIKSKERVKEKLQDYRMREMEMTNFAEAGPLPGAYHG